MTGSSGIPMSARTATRAFAGQRFCDVCQVAIPSTGPAPAGPPPAIPYATPPAPSGLPPAIPYAAPAAPLPPAPYAPGPAGPEEAVPCSRCCSASRSCLALVAGAVLVVAKPFGGGGASPSLAAGTVLASPAVTPTGTGTALASPSAVASRRRQLSRPRDNFTATRKSGSVPCPSADDSCSQTTLPGRRALTRERGSGSTGPDRRGSRRHLPNGASSGDGSGWIRSRPPEASRSSTRWPWAEVRSVTG